MSRRSGGSQRQPGPSTSQQAPSSQDADSTDPALMAIRYGMKNALELVEDLIPACPTEADKQRVTQRLQALMMKFVRAEMSYHESGNMINEAAQEFPDDETLDDKEIFGSCAKILPIAEARMKEYEESLRDNTLKTHPMYVKLLEELQQYGESPDMLEESILADDGGNEHIPVIDPITKTKLTDPVRNSKCKHIYGHAAILQLIKKNSKFRCPTMGCPNNTFIKARDLITDPKLTELVRKKQAEAEQQSEDDS